MIRRTLAATVLALLACRPVIAQVPDLAPYLMTDRAAEVALARTAAQPEISDSATVLVLTRTGYVEAARGTNGFTCVVLRSFSGKLADPQFWNPRTRAPHCFNPPAARTVLPVLLRRAEWTLAGVSNSEVTSRVRAGYASHQFAMPEAGAVAYMLSPHQHLVDADPHWMPHLMFYVDEAVPGATYGAAGFTGPIVDAGANPEAPVRTLLILVRQWSDGSTALPPAAAPPAGR